MNVRVDLLKPEEFRYQGAISRGFLVRAAIGSLVAMIVLLLGFKVVRGQSVRKELATSKEAWTTMEPRYDRIRKIQASLGANRGLAEELAGWQSSRIDWAPALRELGTVVPSDVQLTKLSVKSDLVMIDEEGNRAVDGEIAVRNYNVRIDGRATGVRSDETVVQFVDAIGAASSFQEVLESVRLQGLQRTRSEDENQRVFGIEALAKPRPLE